MNTHPSDELTSLNQLRQTARDLVLKTANLRGQSLAGLRADGVNFEEADLRDCLLADVKWKGCILRDARLEGANFIGAVLRLCDLDQARAANAVFLRTRLENSTARGARFDAADLREAVLTDTDFSRASFRDANLEAVSATGASFRGTDFRGARLVAAELADCDLRGADFTDADLADADLHGADVRGALGCEPAPQIDKDPWGELPPEIRSLAETMSPIVMEVLRTAGQRGALDPQTAEQLMNEAAGRRGVAPRNAPPHADTLLAVSRVLHDVGDNLLPTLIAALQQPNQTDPPPKVQALILRIREELGLNESASTDDILSHLVNGLRRSEP